MDYKKAYEEALEKAKYIKENCDCVGALDVSTCTCFEEIFPELKESEDEKIRNALIKYLDALDDDEIRYGVSFKDMRTWLEKQGEQNEQNFWEKCNHCEYFDGYDICLHKKNFGSVTNESKENCRKNSLFIEKQGDKPAWSEEDERHRKRIVERLEDIRKSKEDNIDVASVILSEISWLKSLKPRWLPTKEQLEVFEHFVRSIGESGYASPYDEKTKNLQSLLYNLKKL